MSSRSGLSPRVLEVAVTDGAGRPVRAPGLARWLQAVAPPRARGRVAVALVPDREMRSMNRRFAGIDRVTDVLSFPSDEALARSRRRERSAETAAAGHEEPSLGDIAIATGRAARQAANAGHGLDEELRVLALHGLLHLLGYDHHGDGGEMARVERRLRRRGGLREGLIERATS
jgi:probable rRNA maturation factor